MNDLRAFNFDPIVVAPFDAELFGHWWFEGPRFLESFIRKAAQTHQDLSQIIQRARIVGIGGDGRLKALQRRLEVARFICLLPGEQVGCHTTTGSGELRGTSSPSSDD